MGEMKNTYKILIRKSERNGRLRHSWENNIEMDHKEMWFGDVD
jgi:hypothetical protein